MTQGSIAELSEREQEILRRVATGATNQQIAVELTISVNTVKAHLRNIFGKLGVESRTEATLYAIQQGLVAVGGRLSAEEGAAVAVEERPTLLPPQAVPWPLHPGQYIAMIVALALVLVVALWPTTRAATMPAGNRMIDVPSAVAPPPAVEPASRWRVRAQMPTPRGRFAQTIVDGRIYVLGGLTEGSWSAQVEVYDPTEDRWDRRAPQPLAMANIGAAAVKGLIYVPGGLDEANQVTDVLQVYDPQADRWSTLSPLPRSLCAYAIAPVEEGFYVLGGWDGQRYLDSVYYYDAAKDAWREEQPLSVPRGFAAAATLDERIYLIGGYDGSTEYSLCESFDPQRVAAGEDPWQRHAPMSVGRAGHSVAVSDGSLYVVGGGWDSYFAYNERYDARNDVWSTFESPMVGEWRTLGLSSAETREGTFLFAIGGWSGRYLGTVQSYQAFYRIYLP